MLRAFFKTSLAACAAALAIAPGAISIPSLGVRTTRDGSAGDADLTVVKQKFYDANIPTNISMNFDPSVLFEVILPQLDESTINVAAGVQLSRNETAIPPDFGIIANANNSDTTELFVIAMIDLDAPTPQAPTSAQIRHFLGSDFALSNDPNSTSGTLSGSDAVQLLKNSSAALSEFLRPSPPAGSHPHRYVFLLFSQPNEFDAQTIVDSSTAKTNFNLSSFAADIGLCDPVGGTFILVGPDASDSTIPASNTTTTNSTKGKSRRKFMKKRQVKRPLMAFKY